MLMLSKKECWFPSLGLGLLMFLGATLWMSQEAHAQSCAVYKKAAQIAVMSNKSLNESSGLAASRKNPGVWWSHNDSGGQPRLFAFDETGKDLGYFTVSGATNIDWEDMAAAPCPNGSPCLYIADFGDNARRRSEVVVYRVLEPKVENKQNRGVTSPATKFILKYPDGAHDCEALLVHPKTRDIFLYTKLNNSTTVLYRLAGSAQPGSHTLEKVATYNFPSDLVTGGDFSPQGDQLVLRGYTYGLVYNVDQRGYPDLGKKPVRIDTGATIQGEAIAYSADGTYLIATSERVPTPILKLACAVGGEPWPEPTPEPAAEEPKPAPNEPQPTQDAGDIQESAVDNSQPKESPDTPGSSSCSCSGLALNTDVGSWLGCLLILLGALRLRRW